MKKKNVKIKKGRNIIEKDENYFKERNNSRKISFFNAKQPIGSQCKVVLDDGNIKFSTIKSPAKEIQGKLVAGVEGFDYHLPIERLLRVK